jgi:hypothetical protein
MRKLDPRIAKQEDLLVPYLTLGAVDTVFDIMTEALQRDRTAWVHSWDILNTWAPESAAFRRNPRFAEIVRRMGLVDYWKQYGYPDGCRAGDGDVAIVCDS